MKAEQDWGEAYKELCDVIKNPNGLTPEIGHIDLWYQQIDNIEEGYPFPPESVFLEFAINSIDTNGLKVQDLNAEIGVYYCFDTLSDSWKDSDNQAIALQFVNMCRRIHKSLQGRAGDHFSGLNRVRLYRYPTNTAGMIVYAQVYSAVIRDYAAYDETTTVQVGNVQLDNSTPPPPSVNVELYDLGQ